jgi:hypothetical protein
MIGAKEVLLVLTNANHGNEIEDQVTLWLVKANGGGRRSAQSVPAQPWSEIERNYPNTVRGQLKELVSRRGVLPGEGRLILFHWEP